MTLWCCGCQREVEAVCATVGEIYPHRTDLHKKRFWRCPTCGNYVGCHPGSEKPLGNIPTPELRISVSYAVAAKLLSTFCPPSSPNPASPMQTMLSQCMCVNASSVSTLKGTGYAFKVKGGAVEPARVKAVNL